MAAVSSTDSVVCVTKASRSGSRTSSFAACSTFSMRCMRPPCAVSKRPIVPSTSGCPAWPINTTSRPSRAYRATSMCTFVTSGHVASNTVSPRRAASFSTAAGTPCAREDYRRAVGHLVELVDEHRAELAQPLDHVHVVHDFVAHVDRRAEQRDGALDDVDRAIDAGAESTGVGEQDLHRDSLTMFRALAERACSRPATRRRDRIDDHTAGADADGGIGDVECGEISRAPMRVTRSRPRNRVRCDR